jgi:hypothetical protein
MEEKIKQMPRRMPGEAMDKERIITTQLRIKEDRITHWMPLPEPPEVNSNAN